MRLAHYMAQGDQLTAQAAAYGLQSLGYILNSLQCQWFLMLT